MPIKHEISVKFKNHWDSPFIPPNFDPLNCKIMKKTSWLEAETNIYKYYPAL